MSESNYDSIPLISAWDYLEMPATLGTLKAAYKSVFAIENPFASPSGCGIGTGFFFEFDLNGRIVPCIVTNKHVIEDQTAKSPGPRSSQQKAVAAFLRCHLWVAQKDASGNLDASCVPCNPLTVHYEIPDCVLLHPNPDIDLAIIGIANLLTAPASRGYLLWHTRCTEKMIHPLPTPQDIQTSNAFTVGFPEQQKDLMVPLIHMGTIEDRFIRTDYGAELIRANTVSNPGSSGSPLFQGPVGFDLLKQPDTPTIIRLLGICFAVRKGDPRIQLGPSKIEASPYIFAIKATELLAFKPLLLDTLSSPSLRSKWVAW